MSRPKARRKQREWFACTTCKKLFERKPDINHYGCEMIKVREVKQPRRRGRAR